jgi:hypothetical protein
MRTSSFTASGPDKKELHLMTAQEDMNSASDQAGRKDMVMHESDRQSFSVVRRAVERTRLTVDGGGTVSVADVSGKLMAALTEYGKGELNVALALVQAAVGLYQEKLNRWERLARQREETVKQRSLQKYRQIKGFHNPIRINARQNMGNFRHLVEELGERVKQENK